MKFPENLGLTSIIRQTLSGPLYPEKEFILSEYTYREIYALAAGIRNTLSQGKDRDAVCLCTENKGLIAASVLASLACESVLILPYALSRQALREVRDETGFTKAITDMPEKLPPGTEALSLSPCTGSDMSLEYCRNPDSAVLKLFTGGSTGKPRLWSKTAHILFSEAACLRKKLKISENDRVIATVPPYHIYGLFLSVLVPFISSASVGAGIYVFPHEILSVMEKASVLVSVPVHYRLLNRSGIPCLTKYSLRAATSSAAFLDKKDSFDFYERTGIGIAEIYGSTETGGIAVRCQARNEKAFIPFDIVDWKIRDKRLAVRSELISPELRKNTDGFFMTGDRAARHDDNSFLLMGREDGIVKVGGKRTDLNEIQDKLKSIPGVRDAVVISIPVTGGRENKIAALVEGNTDASRIRDIISGMVEPYAMPRHIRVVDHIPVTPTGKYDRKTIAKLCLGKC